jgi:hypothetical protein
MNGFKVIKGTALALCLSVTFSAQAFDFAKGLDAAVKLGKAATLSDSDINAYFGQMSKKYDAENTVAPASNKYAKRLATITKGLKNNDVIESGAYREFYMHRTSHWLGLDVHDVGAYSSGQTSAGSPIWRELVAGMVLTIEPGLYIRPAAHVPEAFWNIGIRIEDDALVNDSGCELLTRDVPVTVADIEYLMKHEVAE